jgi:hypothetical protein
LQHSAPTTQHGLAGQQASALAFASVVVVALFSVVALCVVASGAQHADFVADAGSQHADAGWQQLAPFAQQSCRAAFESAYVGAAAMPASIATAETNRCSLLETFRLFFMISTSEL